MNKRGQEGGGIIAVLIWALLALLSVSIVVLAITDSSGNVIEALGAFPPLFEAAVKVIQNVLTPLAQGIFFLVAPAGQPENVQFIAFAIFLLLTLIGTKTLRPFIRGPFLAFFISLIIGIIAGRSLTATILEETALAASPIAAVSLVLGFLPVFALTKNIDMWGLNQWGKMVVFTVAGVVYIVIFWLAFNSRILGLTYGLGIVLLGTAQIIVPYFRKTVKQKKGESLGRYMASVQETVKTVEAMEKGARQAGARP